MRESFTSVFLVLWTTRVRQQSRIAALPSHQPELVRLARPISELFSPVWSEKFFVARRIAASPEVASP